MKGRHHGDGDGATVRDPLYSLSAELKELAGRFSDHRVTLREVMQQLGPRASALMSAILALPFCAPVTIPGLSIPFGIVILMLAARYAMGRPPWLPLWLMETKLPPRFFRALLKAAGSFVGWIEVRLKPRLPWLTETRTMLRLHTVMVALAAALLLLPIGGIPFTNTLPALTIVVGTLGMLERDGVAVLVAYGLLVSTFVYFAIFATAIFELLEKAWHAIAG